MRTVQLSDIFSDDTRNNLLDIYHNFDEYDTAEMNKAPVTPETLELVEETIRQCLGTDYVYVSGNYYHHTQPFYPHTDFKKEWKDSVNIVIPLEDHTNGTGRLVIFDQKWEEDSKTWMMIHPVKHYDVNTALPGCPFDYPITNKTGDNYRRFDYICFKRMEKSVDYIIRIENQSDCCKIISKMEVADSALRTASSAPRWVLRRGR